MSLMRRSFAACLLSIMALAISAPVTCVGWEAAPSERMSCCKRAGHDCVDQIAADNCCAQQEQTHQPGATTSCAAQAAPVSVTAFFAPATYPSAVDDAFLRRYEPALHIQLHDPPGSFALPLRI